MRSSVMAIIFVLVLSTGLMAADRAPGQLVGLRVTAGYHLPTFLVLQGEIDRAGGETTLPKITIFINDFSTRVTPEGRFALAFPKASLYRDKGTIVKVKAVQEGTNIQMSKDFDLATLNDILDREIKFEELWKN